MIPCSLRRIVSNEVPGAVTLATGATTPEVRGLRSNIKSMTAGPYPLMPQGLNLILSPRELADIVAYWQSRRCGWGMCRSPGVAEAPAKLRFDGFPGHWSANTLPPGRSLLHPGARDLPDPSRVTRAMACQRGPQVLEFLVRVDTGS